MRNSKETDLNGLIASVHRDVQNDIRGFFENLESDLARVEHEKEEAERLAEEARENYKNALELQEVEYAQVVKDIFEEPMKELTRKISKYSLLGITSTLAVAILSFYLTAAFSGLSLLSSVAELREASVAERQDLADLQEDLADLRSHIAMSDSGVLVIVQHFNKNFDEDEFDRTKADLERLYKSRPIVTEDQSGFYYHQYRLAFRGMDYSAQIPTSAELRAWDVEAHQLYERWYEAVSERGKEVVALDAEERRYDSFKSKTDDDMSYGLWYNDPNLTFDVLANSVKRKRDAFSGQQSRNG